MENTYLEADMIKKIFSNFVFTVSAAVILFFVVVGASMPKSFGNIAGMLFEFTTINFGWFYLLAVFIIVLFLIGLAVSKYGSIRLGGEGERPEFPFFTWVGMLFSAGFGAGLVFWGIAEPMSHFFNTPFANLEGESRNAARVAMG